MPNEEQQKNPHGYKEGILQPQKNTPGSDPRNIHLRELRLQGYATVDQLLGATFGEWPPKGLDIVGKNSQWVRLSAQTDGYGLVNSQNPPEISTHAGYQVDGMQLPVSGISVNAHELLHILQNIHTHRIRETFPNVNFGNAPVGINTREDLIPCNVAMNGLLQNHTDSVTHQHLRDTLGHDPEYGHFIDELRGGKEVQARLIQLMAVKYPQWGRLPQNQEELWVAMQDAGLKPPPGIQKETAGWQKHMPAGMMKLLGKSSTLRQAHAQFSTAAAPDSHGNAMVLEHLNHVQKSLTPEGREVFWRETIPAMYSDFIEMAGDGRGGERFGLGTNQLGALRELNASTAKELTAYHDAIKQLRFRELLPPAQPQAHERFSVDPVTNVMVRHQVGEVLAHRQYLETSQEREAALNTAQRNLYQSQLQQNIVLPDGVNLAPSLPPTITAQERFSVAGNAGMAGEPLRLNPAPAPNETYVPAGELHMSKAMGFQMAGDQLFDVALNAKNGTTSGWSITRNVVHGALGATMFLNKGARDPVFGGIVAGTEGVLTGAETVMDTYGRTHDIGLAVRDGFKGGGIAAGKAGLGFAANVVGMNVASAGVSSLTAAALGSASEATLATAGTFLGVTGEASAATVGAAAGAAVIPVTIVVGATVLAYKVSDTFIAPAVTHAMYDGVEKQISESGNTTDMKTKATTGLPIIDAQHNKELFDIINRNPAEASKLSANPALAAKGITNAQDPAYIQRKLEEAKQKTDSPGGISGAWGWLKDQAGMNPDKIAEQDKNQTAQTQLIAYEKRFGIWKLQTPQPNVSKIAGLTGVQFNKAIVPGTGAEHHPPEHTVPHNTSIPRIIPHKDHTV